MPSKEAMQVVMKKVSVFMLDANILKIKLSFLAQLDLRPKVHGGKQWSKKDKAPATCVV